MACSCGCSQVVTLVRLPMQRVGELRGVIYRTSRVPGEEPQNYVHFFKDKLPVLLTNRSGNRLYIVGGNYQVTDSGIHG